MKSIARFVGLIVGILMLACVCFSLGWATTQAPALRGYGVHVGGALLLAVLALIAVSEWRDYLVKRHGERVVEPVHRLVRRLVFLPLVLVAMVLLCALMWAGWGKDAALELWECMHGR